MAVDRAAILAGVLRRNALRRQALLPLLDVRVEFERAVAVAIDQEVRGLADDPQHRVVLDRIAEEVRAELFARHGVTGASWGGRYAIARLASQRQMDYLRAVYGSHAKPVLPRHPIRYGGAKQVARTPAANSPTG